MARYDYKCTSCGLVFEVEHPMGAHPEVTCPDCGAAASQVFSASGIVFKGSGFYNTDQRSSGSKGTTAAPATTSDTKPKSQESSSSTSSSSSDTSSSSSSDSKASSTTSKDTGSKKSE